MWTDIVASWWFVVVRDWTLTYLLNIFFAFCILYLWNRFLHIVVQGIDTALDKWWIEHSARKFLISFFRVVLYMVLVIVFATTVWLEMSSLVAILWAAWIAIWLALQGSLANFAWWLLIMFFKPYAIWDFISARGEQWTVEDINIF